MARLHQTVLIVATLVGSWLAMQAVHELGHVLGAALTGSRVERVVLHPLTISRTDVVYGTSPLLVVWAGPVLGVVLPLAGWALATAIRLPERFLLRFFAGFCLVANGAYLGAGSLNGVGDCGDLLRHGAPIWSLWLFGLATLPLGLWLWHGQGRHFGLAPARGQVDRRAAYASLTFCLAILGIELLAGWQ
jgi:hypothetical protein